MGCGCAQQAESLAQARDLRLLLFINAAMFVAEGTAGWLAGSMALISDALDMLADAIVYALSLYAVGRSVKDKAGAAAWSGMFQIALGLGAGAEALRRFFFGAAPEPLAMLGGGALALAANLVCLRIIARHRHGEVHMRASWIFSRNDVLANLGVILAGTLVILAETPWPDLAVGLVIAAIVMQGGWNILVQARARMHPA